MAVRRRLDAKSESCCRLPVSSDPPLVFRFPDGRTWPERWSRSSRPPKSAILAFRNEISRQRSGNLGQASPDFVQTRRGGSILECAPETLGELGVAKAGVGRKCARSDDQRNVLILREVQWLQR